MAKTVLSVTTTKPATSIAAGGGSLVKICPITGTIQSSLRLAGDLQGKAHLGVSTLSLFPSRQASLPPILHWKTRLPEGHMSSGALVSLCGCYIACGGKSGSVYIWSSLGGSLLRSFKAHYGEVTHCMWAGEGRILVTGGADGVVHAFSMAEVVDYRSSEDSIRPIRSWSNHLLPVTAIVPLAGGRIASSSLDTNIFVMEVFSESMIASLKMPCPIQSLVASNSQRLFAGGVDGTVFVIDMDEYAIHQSIQAGAAIQRPQRPRSMDNVSRVFSSEAAPSDSETAFVTDSSYVNQLKGHDRPVTALSFFMVNDESQQREREWLCSGDEQGEIRVWDLESRGCVRVLRPWSAETVVAGKQKQLQQTAHPVSSITVVIETDEASSGMATLLSSHTGSKNASAPRERNPLASQITPLQRFSLQHDGRRFATLPFLSPNFSRETEAYWDVTTCDFDYAQALRKRIKRNTTTSATSDGGAGSQDDTSSKRINELEAQLSDAKKTISRWEIVSQKLTERIEQQS